MENFHVSLQLEQRSPRFVRADLARIPECNFSAMRICKVSLQSFIPDLVQVTFLDMHSHFASTLKFIAAEITIPVLVWRQNAMSLLVSREIPFALQNLATNRTWQMIFASETFIDSIKVLTVGNSRTLTSSYMIKFWDERLGYDGADSTLVENLSRKCHWREKNSITPLKSSTESILPQKSFRVVYKLMANSDVIIETVLAG